MVEIRIEKGQPGFVELGGVLVVGAALAGKISAVRIDGCDQNGKPGVACDIAQVEGRRNVKLTGKSQVPCNSPNQGLVDGGKILAVGLGIDRLDVLPHGAKAGRAAIGIVQTREMGGAPIGARGLHLVDAHAQVDGNRDGQPARHGWARDLNPVDVTVLAELNVIQENECVRRGDLSEVAQPGKIVGLMHSDDHEWTALIRSFRTGDSHWPRQCR